MKIKPLASVAYSVIALGCCLALGKVLAQQLSGLPSSLYGLIIFTALLQFNIISSAPLTESIEWIIRHMGICFVPAGVGIIDQFDLVKSHGIAMVAITLFTTFILMTFVGLAYQKHLDNHRNKEHQ